MLCNANVIWLHGIIVQISINQIPCLVLKPNIFLSVQDYTEAAVPGLEEPLGVTWSRSKEQELGFEER